MLAEVTQRSGEGADADDRLTRLRSRLHDTVLQTLEYIAGGGGLGDRGRTEEVMRLAAREATQLREYLEDMLDGESTTLAEGLERVVAQARCMADQHIELVKGPMDGSVSGTTAVDVLGAVREAVTNACKHARASTVRIVAAESKGTVTVSVEDDGVGLDPERVRPGLGLRHSIMNRIRALGGRVTLDSAPGRGTRVRLTVPAVRA